MPPLMPMRMARSWVERDSLLRPPAKRNCTVGWMKRKMATVVSTSSSVSGRASASGVPGMGQSSTLAHAYDAARAHLEAYLACKVDGVYLVVYGVGGAKLLEVARSSLEVAVIASHAGVPELLKLVAAEESE